MVNFLRWAMSLLSIANLRASLIENQDPRLSAQLAVTSGRQAGKATLFEKNNESKTDIPPEQNDSDLTQLEVRFFNDWEQLSTIQFHETKNAKKAELLPNYIPWIEDTISQGIGSQNDMLLKLMIWCLDTHQLTIATNIAEFALLNDMVMPEPFSRDVATTYAEQMADESKQVESISDLSDIYTRAIDITTDHDMPDQIRAKLYRALGDTQADSHPADAIVAYERAIKLDDNVVCKTDLKNLLK